MRALRIVGIVVAIVVLLIGGGLAWLITGDSSLPVAPVSVDVPPGYGIGQIALATA